MTMLNLPHGIQIPIVPDGENFIVDPQYVDMKINPQLHGWTLVERNKAIWAVKGSQSSWIGDVP